MGQKASQQQPLNILLGSGVPRRREGGVAAIIYNLGRELEHLGHHVKYVFQEDLIEPGSVSPRFNELVFSLRLGRYIAGNRKKFSIVNLHAPTGFPYGLLRRWHRSGVPAVRDDPPWTRRTASPRDEPRGEERPRLELFSEESPLAKVLSSASVSMVDSHRGRRAHVQS